MKLQGKHSGTVVSTVATQLEGPGYISWIGVEFAIAYCVSVGFLPLSKSMHYRLSVDFKLAL